MRADEDRRARGSDRDGPEIGEEEEEETASSAGSRARPATDAASPKTELPSLPFSKGARAAEEAAARGGGGGRAAWGRGTARCGAAGRRRDGRVPRTAADAAAAGSGDLRGADPEPRA